MPISFYDVVVGVINDPNDIEIEIVRARMDGARALGAKVSDARGSAPHDDGDTVAVYMVARIGDQTFLAKLTWMLTLREYKEDGESVFQLRQWMAEDAEEWHPYQPASRLFQFEI